MRTRGVRELPEPSSYGPLFRVVVLALLGYAFPVSLKISVHLYWLAKNEAMSFVLFRQTLQSSHV